MSRNSKVDEKNHDLALITYKSPKSSMSEAYRILRTNLGFAGMEQPFRSVLVTSAVAEDGKSTIVANLAVVTAQAGYNVMLVDCDLRKPVQHKIFQIPNNTGFSNCVLNQEDPNKVAYSLSLSNLKVLTSGPIPPNPAEILNSQRTRSLWPTLQSQYDYVFVDCPPILAVSDASILASQLDGALLVVRYGVTRIEQAQQARNQLINGNARILGVVMNRVKVDKKQTYGYYG